MTVVKQYRQTPTYTQPLTQANNTHPSWYRLFQDLHTGKPPQAENAVTLTGSPFTYSAGIAGFLIVTGGTVSLIKFVRNGTYTTGQTSGTFPLSAGDSLIITYSGAPIVTFVPQ